MSHNAVRNIHGKFMHDVGFDCVCFSCTGGNVGATLQNDEIEVLLPNKFIRTIYCNVYSGPNAHSSACGVLIKCRTRRCVCCCRRNRLHTFHIDYHSKYRFCRANITVNVFHSTLPLPHSFSLSLFHYTLLWLCNRYQVICLKRRSGTIYRRRCHCRCS